MKNKKQSALSYFALGSFVITLMIICFMVVHLKNMSRTDDYQPLTISKIEQGPPPVSFIKGLTYKTKFKAYSNNLGTVTFRFGTLNFKKKDFLLLRIKEHSADKWYYSNPYRTDWFQDNLLYPFGFPIIQDSRGKIYDVELTSLNGTLDNHLRLDEPTFITKYVYRKSDILPIKNGIPIILEKVTSIFENLTVLDIFIVFLPLLALILILRCSIDIAFRISYCWTSLFNDISKAISLRRIFRWRRVHEVASIFLYINIFWGAILFIKNVNFVYKIIVFMPLLLLLVFLSKKIWRYMNEIYLHKDLLIVLLIHAAVKALFINVEPRWDGKAYYDIIQRSFDIIKPTLINFGEAFSLFGHPSHGYSTYFALSRAIFGKSIVGIHVFNTILGICTLIAFYGFIKKVYKLSANSSALYTLLLALNPLFIAVSLTQNVDYPTICFLAMAMSFLVYDKLILSAFFWILLVFSKETGLLIYLLFVFFELFSLLVGKSLVAHLYYARFKMQSKHRAFSLFCYSIYVGAPVILFIFNYFMSSARIWQPNYYVFPHTPIVFNSEIFFTRFGEIFILNFQWVLFLVMVLSLIKSKRLFAPLPLVLTAFSYLVILGFYNTYLHARYIIPLHLLFLLIAIPHTEFIIKKRPIINIFLLGFSILLLIQNFDTIDVVSMKLFGNFQWGKYTFIKIGDQAQSRCDGITYNTQYTNIQGTFKKLHQALGNSSYTIIVNNLVKDQTSNKWIQRYYHAPFMEVSELGQIKHPKGQLYYVFLPWLSNNKDEGMGKIRKYYTVGKMQTIDIDGYWLRYYKLTKLNR